MYKTAVGKLLCMCQERADIMYSLKEKARKITCPIESDEMNVKRIARYLKNVPIAKCLIRIETFPPFVNVYPDSDWAGHTPNVQEHKWWSCAAVKRDSFCMVKNTAVSEPEFCRSRIIRLENWNSRRDGDEASLERTGIRSDSREPFRHSICEGMVIHTRFGTDETCNVEVRVRARRRGEEADDTCPCQHEFEQRKPDDKVSYF